MPRRIVNGYTDLGSVQVPPLPRYTVMADRDTGALWFLAWNLEPVTGDGLGWFSLRDDVPVGARADNFRYGPYDGPVLWSKFGMVRLLIRGGRLGFEILPDTGLSYASDGRIMARVGVKREWREIIFPTNGDGKTLAWQQVTA